MKKARICLMAVAAVFCALVLSPGVTRADELTGSSGNLVDRRRHDVRDGYDTGRDFAILPGHFFDLRLLWRLRHRNVQRGTSSISYSVSDFPVGDYTGTTNGFPVRGLDVRSGDSLPGSRSPQVRWVDGFRHHTRSFVDFINLRYSLSMARSRSI